MEYRSSEGVQPIPFIKYNWKESSHVLEMEVLVKLSINILYTFQAPQRDWVEFTGIEWRQIFVSVARQCNDFRHLTSFCTTKLLPSLLKF